MVKKSRWASPRRGAKEGSGVPAAEQPKPSSGDAIRPALKLSDLARRILDSTTNPIDARDRFIRATLFDLMTGNVDNHAKNFALLHIGRDRIVIAPLYDLLPTRLDPNLTDELAFRIGAAETLAAITKTDFYAFLEVLGLRGAARRANNRAPCPTAGRRAERNIGGAGSQRDEAICRSDRQQSAPDFAGARR